MIARRGAVCSLSFVLASKICQEAMPSDARTVPYSPGRASLLAEPGLRDRTLPARHAQLFRVAIRCLWQQGLAKSSL